MYVASGLLEYSDQPSFDALVKPFITSGATRAIYYKENYIDRRGLSGEQGPGLYK